MPTLLVQLALDLVEPGSQWRGWMDGLAFHRWLPDGLRDVVRIDLGDRRQLQLWLDRTGYVRDGFIEFDRVLRDVDATLVSQQGLLFANPLRGTLELPNVTDEEASVLREERFDDAAYKALGRGIVKLLDPVLVSLIEHLRTRYGQRWITPFRLFDSRTTDVASRCVHLNLRWSVGAGTNWARLTPSHDPVALIGGRRRARDFLQYITEEDWAEIARCTWFKMEPPLAAQLLARATELSDHREQRAALVEGVTALEIALDAFVRRNLTGPSALRDSLSAFGNLSLPTKLGIVAASVGVKDAARVEQTLRAISLRNRIVHEGWTPEEDVGDVVNALLSTVRALLRGSVRKSPATILDNWRRSPEEWEREYARDARTPDDSF